MLFLRHDTNLRKQCEAVKQRVSSYNVLQEREKRRMKRENGVKTEEKSVEQ